jgi:tRNA1Val (adenine37-N6)-methyltransferase
LLGAFAEADNPKRILDIGTGTGVIALMLAQKFAQAHIDAVEIDAAAAKTAALNFERSPFGERLNLAHHTFQDYFRQYPEKKYDLIISNPPFYINSLESPGEKTNLAKHTDGSFFEELVSNAAAHLTPNGKTWLILPIPTSQLVKTILSVHGLYINKIITIRSFNDMDAHREILVFGHIQTALITDNFVIYDEPKVYSEGYKNKLRDFFTIF